jgi:hypothetical protein
MIRIFLSILICFFLYTPIDALCAQQKADITSPVQVVAAFQKLPNYEMFCLNESRRDWEPIKVGAKFDNYFSKNLNKLFLWSQCRYPDTPPFYDDLHNLITWDIRFGSGYLSTHFKADNIRVQPAKLQRDDRAIVQLLFDHGTLKNITTTYTLILEEGHWKIDDIAPKGDFKADDENYDAILQHSDSIKTDMQNNYNAAVKRYQQEQAKKIAPPKP